MGLQSAYCNMNLLPNDYEGLRIPLLERSLAIGVSHLDRALTGLTACASKEVWPCSVILDKLVLIQAKAKLTLELDCGGVPRDLDAFWLRVGVPPSSYASRDFCAIFRFVGP
jgi:hypothetical protein